MHPFIVENEIKYRRLELEQSTKHCYAQSLFDTDKKEKSKCGNRWNILLIFNSFFKKFNFS